MKKTFLSDVATSPHGDRNVLFGDIVMLKNSPMNKTVSTFSDNELHWMITGSSLEKSVTRNSFKIVPFESSLNEELENTPVRYTQPFALQSLINPELYLASDAIRKMNSISNISYGRNEIFMARELSKVNLALKTSKILNPIFS